MSEPLLEAVVTLRQTIERALVAARDTGASHVVVQHLSNAELEARRLEAWLSAAATRKVRVHGSA